MLEEAGAQGLFVENLALQALALQAQGRHTEALDALERTLAVAEPEGYVRTLIDEGAPIGELLAAVQAALRARRGETARRLADYAASLLAALSGKPSGVQPDANALLLEPLSGRELEILRFLATTLSIPEIAQELVISANTVRSHVKCIYGKLDAHGRMHVLQRARELGLLP